MTERTLLRQLKAGDTGAPSEIIGIYTPYLYTIASNIMAPQLPREDIEEAVSDAFVELWTHRAELLPGKLKPWLAAVVRNKAKDALRAHRLAEPLNDDLLEIACEDDAERELLQKELGELAREAVDSMGEPDREIFRRHYFLYQKTEEIAKSLGLKDTTVRTKLSRGRKRLKEYLTERGFRCEDMHY